MDDETLNEAARYLRDATRTEADLPERLRPKTEAEAYRIQDLIVGDAPVVGWKILAVAAPDAFSCAPIFREFPDGAPQPADPWEVEVEVAIEVVSDLPPEAAPFSAETVDAALGGAYCAFELVQSRFIKREDVSTLTALADAQANLALVMGSGGANWREMDLAHVRLTLEADGRLVKEETNRGASAAQTLQALTWLANHAAARGGLRKGQFVITGARIGPFDAPKGALTARIDGLGEAHLSA